MSKFRTQAAPAIFWLGLFLFIHACRPAPLECADALGCVVVRPNSPVRLATLLPMSGETAVWGQSLSQAIDLAIADWGDELLDHPIELISLDAACDPAVGQQALQTIGGDDTIVGIIGPACSSVATAIRPTVASNRWLMISPASSAPELTENQGEAIFFRTVPNHLTQATAAAHFAFDELGARQTAVIQDGTAFNALLAEQFSRTFTQLGGTVSYQGSLLIGQNEMEELLAETAVTRPELIYLALFEPEAGLVVNRLAEAAALSQVPLLGGDSLQSAAFAADIGQIGAGTEIYLTGPTFTGEAYATFLDSWRTLYEALPESPTPAYAYDATQLLLSAVEDVAVVGQTGALVIGRAALRERLTTLTGLNGVTGLLRCDAAGECAAPGYGVYELDTAVLREGAWPPPLIWHFSE